MTSELAAPESNIASEPASTAMPPDRPNGFGTFFRQFWLPLLAVLVLSGGAIYNQANWTTFEDSVVLSKLAYHLGHAINSAWVGIGLLLLIVPSLVRRYRDKQSDPWAWRAVDAIVLDFLLVDALGKNLLTSFVRPGDSDKPGFPSGHATMAFALATLIANRYPKLGPLWFAIAALISWSRVACQAHYAYQVIAGSIYGLVIGYLVLRRTSGVLLPRIFLSDKTLLDRLSSK